MTHADVKTRLLSLAQPERAVDLARFFKTGPGQYGEGDQFLGLSMPQIHTVVRQFCALPIVETEQLLHDTYHECRMTALLIWVDQVRSARASRLLRQEIATYYLNNRQYVNNWDLVDVTCPHILGQYLLSEDRSVLYELAQQDHLWSQRIAIVSTMTFIRKGQFADTFALAELLFSHPHDLIHKAVGWMLREVGKRNADALDEFLHDHVHQMPRTSLRYAIERFTPARRQYYLRL